METGTSQQKITLAFINDKSPILDLICSNLIASEYDVLFRSENIEDGISKLSILNVLPRICFIDINFYDKDILVKLQKLRKQYPKIKLIAHSDIDDEKIGENILNIGFSGYLLVGSATDEIKTVIDVICQGGKYFSSGINEIARSHFNNTN